MNKYVVQQKNGTLIVRESIVIDYKGALATKSEWERTDLSKYGIIKYINQSTDIRITVINSEITTGVAV